MKILIKKEDFHSVLDPRRFKLDLRKWNHKIGIILAPLLILQATSGIFLSIDWDTTGVLVSQFEISRH